MLNGSFIFAVLPFLLILFVYDINYYCFSIKMSTITVIRVDTAGSRARVEGYLADARRTVAGGAAPVIPPPTEDQMEHEPVIPQQEQSQKQKRKRGRPDIYIF